MELENKTLEKEAMELVDKADIIIVNTVRKMNYDVILMYWDIGKMVCEFKEKNNSKYGDAVVKTFSEKLYMKYGPKFNRNNIYRAIQFYGIFSKLRPAGETEKGRAVDQLSRG